MIDTRTVRGFAPGDEVGIRAVMEASLAVDAVPGFVRSDIDRALLRVELVRWGVTELRRRGAGPIELTVEAANDQAATLYRAHDFVPAIEWPHWRLPTR